MLTLHGFGRAFGLPDPSPFVVKTEVMLKLAGLDYQRKTGNLGKAPKGKLPLIDDGGTIVADSTLIRFHLETTRGIDFDKGLDAAQKGVAWAFEKLLEDHLYWIVVRERWLDPANFDRGPRKFFDKVPAPLRPVVLAMVKRQVRGNLKAQGLGRHSGAELAAITARGIDGLSAYLGDKPWLMGDRPCGADATVFAFVSGGLCPLFQSTVRTRMEQHPNLIGYRDRGMQLWFADLA